MPAARRCACGGSADAGARKEGNALSGSWLWAAARAGAGAGAGAGVGGGLEEVVVAEDERQ